MNRKRAIEFLKDMHPKNEYELLKQCGFELKLIGDGAYRNTYSIAGTDLIVKVPYQDVSAKRKAYSIEHTLLEMAAIRKIKNSRAKRWQMFKRLLPEVPYVNYTTGVIVMQRCYKVGARRHKDAMLKLDRLVSHYHHVEDCDLDNSGNYAEDKDGNLKIIDFGCFLEGNTTCPSS